MRRYQIGAGGKETNNIEKEIDYVMGSGNHVRTYLHRTSRNTLVELPLAWYAENGGSWGMNPGYDRPSHPGFRRAIPYACMFCHNAIPDIPSTGGEPAAEAIFLGRMPDGIDCQRCHGPGARHVAMVQTGGARLKDIRSAIVNPARLSPEREMDVCLQCHLETSIYLFPNSLVRFDRAPFSYKPGEPLSSFEIYFERVPANDKFEIASAGYRLLQSACFRQSAGRLRCTTCHNPHDISRGEKAAQHYTQVCRECHEAKLTQLADAGKHTSSNDCVGCHMPKRRTDDVVHTVVTDHYIQRRKPPRDLLAPMAEWHGTEQSADRREVVLFTPPRRQSGRDSELYLAVAQATQKNNLQEGIERLTKAIEKYQPAGGEFHLQLGDALVASGQAVKSIAVYEEAIRREPGSFQARRQLAIALRVLRQFPRAVEVLKQHLQENSGDAKGWYELGLDDLGEGMRSDAVSAFQKAISLDEDMAEAYNSLGVVWLENGDPGQGERALRDAVRIQPEYAEAHSNLAGALSADGRFEEARQEFETAIRLQPNNPAPRFNYGLALARVHRTGEARREIETLLRMDPANASGHDLLGSLLVAGGEIQPALAQFREALRLRPDFGRARLDLAQTLAKAGDIAEAVREIQVAATNPESDIRREATALLERIEKERYAVPRRTKPPPNAS